MSKCFEKQKIGFTMTLKYKYTLDAFTIRKLQGKNDTFSEIMKIANLSNNFIV